MATIKKCNSFFILGILTLALLGWGCSELTSVKKKDKSEHSSETSEKSVIAQDTLFLEVNSPVLSKQQKDTLQSIENRLSTTKVHLGRLTKNSSSFLQKEGPIELNIVPDRSVVTIKEKIKQLNDGITYWRGTLQNQRGYVQFTASESGVTGYLKAPSDSLFYKFQPIGGKGDLHALIQVHDTYLDM